MSVQAEFIQPRHYVDVVAERAVAKVCGYPLCSKPCAKLPGKYRIDTRAQVVIDITDLKVYFLRCTLIDWFAAILFETLLRSIWPLPWSDFGRSSCHAEYREQT